jgi:2-dehydro-3-deoxyphosphogluconate aldolase / (4S)-4-hydroxy-2-oxoglutarate aldolase
MRSCERLTHICADHILGLVPAGPTIQRSSAVAAAIRERRLVAVLRRIEPQARLIAFVDELVADGLRLFEITFDGTDAAADLDAVRGRLATTAVDAFVGAGTVRTREQLEAAIAAGAAFAVSPVLDPVIVEMALAAGLPFVPGAYSPTEIDAAWRAGATFVKLFPGSSLGPEHVRELRGPLPEIETMVTGGVDGENAVAFLRAGAVAIGIGSALGRMTSAERRALVAAVGTAT